jgi:maleate isomerase
MTVPALDYGSGGRIGLLLPSVNQAAEPQLRAMLPADIAIAVTRLKLVDSAEASLLGMARDVEPAAGLLADAGVDIVVFHCTAVSTYSTELEASILARIQSATGLPCVATSQALVAALQALSARRVVLISPYTAAVNEREAAYFAEHGFEILGNAGLDCRTGREMMAITPRAWHAFATRHAQARVDAYVLSCTTVRTAETIEALERSLGRPVVTSNTAVAWYCMRKLGVLAGVAGYGRLLARAGAA